MLQGKFKRFRILLILSFMPWYALRILIALFPSDRLTFDLIFLTEIILYFLLIAQGIDILIFIERQTVPRKNNDELEDELEQKENAKKTKSN